MSAYENFVKDFPKRCGEILDRFQAKAKLYDRDVTLLLAITGVGLIFPLERLEPGNSSPDRDRCKKAQQQWDRLKNNNAPGSVLWKNAELEKFTDPEKWRYANLKRFHGCSCIDSTPDMWTELDDLSATFKASSMKLEVVRILRCIRNALAHGNVHTKGDPIGEIVFVSNGSKRNCPPDWWALQCTPSELSILMSNWFWWLQNLKLPNEMLGSAVLDLAAA